MGTVLIVANNFMFLGEYTIRILCGKDEVGEGPYYVNVYNPKSVIINNMPFHCFVREKCTFLGLNNYLVQKLRAFQIYNLDFIWTIIKNEPKY